MFSETMAIRRRSRDDGAEYVILWVLGGGNRWDVVRMVDVVLWGPATRNVEREKGFSLSRGGV